MVAFDVYRKQTPWWWALLVIVLTPVPSTVVAIAVNFLPLVDPQRGWQANYMVSVRGLILVSAGIFGLQLQRVFFLPNAVTFR